MQYTPIHIIKQRQERYDRLLKMIKGFHRSNQDLKMLEKIKLDTIFQISLRFRGCQANKTYKFPKTQYKQQQSIEEDNQLFSNKQMMYNLFTQNNSFQQSTQSKPNRIGKLSDQKSILKHRTEVLVQPQKVLSLGRTKNRYSKQRIDRIQNININSKRQKLKTERVATQKNQFSNQKRERYNLQQNSSKVSTKKLHHQFHDSVHKSHKNSIQHNHSNHFKNMITLQKVQISKMMESPSKLTNSQDGKRKLKLKTQEGQLTLKKIAGKKLYTQQMQTIKKGKIHNFLSNQIKKVQKTAMINQLVLGNKFKPKNLFQKQIF